MAYGCVIKKVAYIVVAYGCVIKKVAHIVVAYGCVIKKVAYIVMAYGCVIKRVKAPCACVRVRCGCCHSKQPFTATSMRLPMGVVGLYSYGL